MGENTGVFMLRTLVKWPDQRFWWGEPNSPALKNYQFKTNKTRMAALNFGRL